jgi:DNA invertase Pin-like site-specific DNA recombinase
VVVIYAKGPDGNPLWDYAVRRGWEENVHVVTGLDALIRLVRAGKVEIVLASSLNGLGRSVSHLVQVLREFVSLRVILIIPNSRIDTSKCPAKAFLGVLDAISEFKHSAAAEAMRTALNRARRRGVKLGRPEKVAAYRKDVLRLRARGLTGRVIAKELGIPSSTAFKLIKGVRVSLARQGAGSTIPSGNLAGTSLCKPNQALKQDALSWTCSARTVW